LLIPILAFLVILTLYFEDQQAPTTPQYRLRILKMVLATFNALLYLIDVLSTNGNPQWFMVIAGFSVVLYNILFTTGERFLPIFVPMNIAMDQVLCACPS
jgi:hypothetical protein